jgi:4-amino-4-deoxy-L-arabinose transferase-like glycosyltransferase
VTDDFHTNKTAKIISIASLFLSLLLITVFPMMTDEAYYVDWARSYPWPSLGFFDHPPLVSWLGLPSRLVTSIWIARILVWIVAACSALILWNLARHVNPARSFIPVAIMVSSLGGLASGVLLTPDSGLLLAWIIAVHESFFAISGSPRRWLTAGIATGLGILSKYTMFLIGPIFLLALLKEGRKQLRSPWPYLGGVACLIVILPHLWWQQSNNWVTFKFQLRHGFSMNHGEYANSTLPRAIDASDTSKAFLAKERLILAMTDVSGFKESLKKTKPEKTRLERAWQYSGDYLGGVAGLWGMYSIFGLIALIRFLKNKNNYQLTPEPLGFSVIKYSALFPLVFFGVLSPFTKIEANWPAMHMSALTLWATWRSRSFSPKVLYLSFGTHVAIFALLTLILAKPELAGTTRENRILLESRGYKSLSQWLNEQDRDTIIAVDSYQLKSNIRFYGPIIKVVQWPGFTRDSEYTRGRLEDLEIEQKILAQNQISVISTSGDPKSIPGYEATRARGIRVCNTGSIGVFSENHPELPCKTGLREWWIFDYELQKP